MPLVPVTAHFADPDGSPSSGSVSFVPDESAPLWDDSPSPRLVSPVPVEIPLGDDGHLSTQLYTPSHVVGDVYTDLYDDKWAGAETAGIHYVAVARTSAGEREHVYRFTLLSNGVDLASLS